MNTYSTTGRLTDRAVLRSTQTGKKLASFTLAINTGYGQNKSTLYLDCTAWEGLADVIDKCTDKGSQIAITGNLQSESWEKDGQKKSKITCTVKNLELLGGKKTESNEPPKVDEIDLEEAFDQMPF